LKSDITWIIPSIISTITIIIGWLVLFHNAKKLATRNETKSQLNESIEILNDATEYTLNYWLNYGALKNSSTLFSIQFMSKITKFQASLEVLETRGIDITGVNYADFLNHCTLDCEKIEAMEDIIQRSLSISNDSQELYDNITKKYYDVYAPSF